MGRAVLEFVIPGSPKTPPISGSHTSPGHRTRMVTNTRVDGEGGNRGSLGLKSREG